MIDYNYLFDLTPISKDEQLICSDYLEDREQEILANCLRFNYKTIDWNGFCNYGYGNGYENRNSNGHGGVYGNYGYGNFHKRYMILGKNLIIYNSYKFKKAVTVGYGYGNYFGESL